MKIFSKVIAILIVATAIFSCSPIFATNDIPHMKDTFDKKVGINGLVDCKFANIKASGVYRELHNFGWTFDSNSGKCYFKSSQYDFDEFYRTLYYSGVSILPCIKQGFNKSNKENKPVDDGANTKKPESYKTHSNVMFNYAARYGSTKVAVSRLNITQGTEPKTGLGYINYFENWNEPNKNIYGESAEFSAEEFAAMCSADYDGHEGKLGNNYGIKQADSNSKLVCGGLTSGTDYISYLNAIKKWSEDNRESKNLPFDVISFHYYSDDKTPEASNFVSEVESLIKWKNENAPDKEIWLTEFGWDTNIASPNGAVSTDSQRDWIVREYLIADKIGLDKSFVYTLRDEANTNSSNPHNTSGLTTQKGKEERKSSWYGVNTLKSTLNGFSLKDVIKEDDNLYIYKYNNPYTNEDCYALWCPTSNGTVIDNYELNIGDSSKASLIQMQNEAELGVVSELAINNAVVNVRVSESPIFVKVQSNSNNVIFKSTETLQSSNTNYENLNAQRKDYDSSIASETNNSEAKQSAVDNNLIKLASISALLTVVSCIGLFI